jgi:DNA helicase-2/ATP-dependent DNA helicase PcrA
MGRHPHPALSRPQSRDRVVVAAIANKTGIMILASERHDKAIRAMDSAWLDGLNPEQRRAATHGGAGSGPPLLVIAGAGTGKTATLAHRVAHHIANGADPGRILLLTFSRRAAAEMVRRVERIVAAATGGRPPALTWSGTFHAVGARLIRDHAGALGLAPDFTILDREDAADLMNIVRHELGLSRTESRFPQKGTCLAIYSRTVNAEAPLGEMLAENFPWCVRVEAELRRLFTAYVEAKQRQSVLDYDDLLLYWAAMMEDQAIAAELGGRFDHVLVDEYQDTNRLQASILLRLKPDGRGVTVVGDDAQSIYAFRAARVRNILDFPAAYTPPAEVVTLTRNYRSTEPILAAANAVIGLAAERFTKNLRSGRMSSELPGLVSVRDEADQALCVVERVLDNREAGIPLRRQAVLFRAAQHSARLELELRRRNIPFVKYGGLRFLDAVHVKDVLACLRFAENPRDRMAGFRLLQLIPGIGPAIAGRLLDTVAASADGRAALAAFAPPARAAEDWRAFAHLYADISGGDAWPAEIGRVRAWYEPHLERLHDDAAIRAADLVQLERIAETYPSRERFLTELALDPPEATGDEAGAPHRDEDWLVLSTIHSAKGQEWNAVFVLNAVDGCIPSDMATGSGEEIEEERRLLYVAITRARDRLALLVPQRFYVHQQRSAGDRHLYAARTRFIPDPLLPLFARESWPPAAAPGPASPGAAPRLEIGARLRGMWR